MKSLALVAFAAACLAPSMALAVPRPGEVPPPLTVTTIAGKAATLAPYNGQAIYVNFFASWCPPCRVETPDIVRLSKLFKARGLQVVGIDTNEDPSKAAGFAKEFAIPYPVFVDTNWSTQASWGTIAFPVHVFIGRGGKVRRFVQGPMTAAQIEAAIMDALRS